MTGLSNKRYHGIQRIFDNFKMNYIRKTIIQASDLKDDFNPLKINRYDNTIFSMDEISMQPSIKFSIVKLAVAFFARDLPTKEKTTINRCLDMLHFGMDHTLLTFEEKYWNYDGVKSVTERGITIGG